MFYVVTFQIVQTLKYRKPEKEITHESINLPHQLKIFYTMLKSSLPYICNFMTLYL